MVYCRYNNALIPRFPIGVMGRTFALVQEHLEHIQYTGPVSLSCDDTKLQPGLDPVFDKQQDGVYILGGVGEPLRVANPEELSETLKNEGVQKADKVSIFVISCM